jgi:Aspartyl protease
VTGRLSLSRMVTAETSPCVRWQALRRATRIFGVIVIALVSSATAYGAEPARSVTVPIRILGNFPIVTATIDGVAVPLLFDLGDTSSLVLTQAVLDRIKAQPSEKSHRFKDLEGNVIVAPMFKVPRLQIGSAVFFDITASLDAHDPSYPSNKVGQEGYLGMALLQSYRVVVDYRRHRLTLIPSGSAKSEQDACRGAAVPFLPEWKGAAVTKAHTDLGEMTLVWDTGAPASLMRKSRVEEARPGNAAEVLTTKQFVLGIRDFGPLEFQVLDYTEPVGSDGFVGYNFFAKNVVCIDFPGKRFLIRQ